MGVGAFYIDKGGLDDFERALIQMTGGVKDLSKVYRSIGKKAGMYVKTHEPIYAGSSKDSRAHKPPGYMQSKTRGGGGKTGAFAIVSQVDYLFLQEFGGSSFWHRGVAGSVRKANKGHLSHAAQLAAGKAKGHIVYKKPRQPRGYFIWNVAYRLRSVIGRELCTGLQDIGSKYGIVLDIESSALDIEETTGGTQ